MKKILFLSLLVTANNTFGMDTQPQKSSDTILQVWDGEYYRKNSRPQFDAAAKHLASMSFAGCTQVLDIGCGPGNITDFIAAQNPTIQVEGSDASDDMITAAKKAYTRSNLSFRVLDAQNMDYNQTAEKALCLLTLHWIADKKAFFRGLFNSLKPNGEFFITTGTKNDTMEALKRKWFGALLQNPKWYFLLQTDLVTAANATSKEELTEMAQEVGFKDIKIREEIEHHTFASTDELVKFFGTFVSGYKDIAALTPQTRQELISDAATEWVKLFPSGEICYKWANLVAKGRKPVQ